MTIKTDIINRKIVVKTTSAQISEVDLFTSTDADTLVFKASGELVKKSGDTIDGSLQITKDLQVDDRVILSNSQMLNTTVDTITATDFYCTMVINGSGFAIPLYTYDQVGNMVIGSNNQVF